MRESGRSRDNRLSAGAPMHNGASNPHGVLNSMSWTEERIERLKSMWTKGATASQIAEELGGVSRNAVIGKAHRLGLESRPSPVKAGEEKEKKAPAKAGAAPAPKVAKPTAAPK